MEDLDKVWIWNDGSNCDDSHTDEYFSKCLGLRNMEGIFMMVAGGIFSGTVLILIEITYERCRKRNTGSREVEGGGKDGGVPMMRESAGINDDNEDDDDGDHDVDDDHSDNGIGRDHDRGAEVRRMLIVRIEAS